MRRTSPAASSRVAPLTSIRTASAVIPATVPLVVDPITSVTSTTSPIGTIVLGGKVAPCGTVAAAGTVVLAPVRGPVGDACCGPAVCAAARLVLQIVRIAARAAWQIRRQMDGFIWHLLVI